MQHETDLAQKRSQFHYRRDRDWMHVGQIVRKRVGSVNAVRIGGGTGKAECDHDFVAPFGPKERVRASRTTSSKLLTQGAI